MKSDAAASLPLNEGDSIDPRVEGSRMSFGDHLEELRLRVILALVGVAMGTAVCLFFGKYIVEFICHPLFVVQQAVGLKPNLTILSPTGLFTLYLWMSFLAGLILTMPWVLWQGWQFVAVGLYAHERRFVRRLVPVSFLLFGFGVLFLYYVALPIALWFFVSFNASFPIGDITPNAFQRLILPAETSTPDPPTQPATLNVPVLSNDPENAKVGDVWVNGSTRRMMFKGPTGVWSLPFEVGTTGVMQSQFAIDSYVNFVLLLALAFGIAFETPVIVFFLAQSGLVPVSEMRRLRRYIIMAIVIIAAVLTPPDVLSQCLLGVPMYLLFEFGLAVARIAERRKNGHRPAQV